MRGRLGSGGVWQRVVTSGVNYTAAVPIRTVGAVGEPETPRHHETSIEGRIAVDDGEVVTDVVALEVAVVVGLLVCELVADDVTLVVAVEVADVVVVLVWDVVGDVVWDVV